MALNVGIIGTGWFSKMHARILSDMDGVSVAAFVGTSQDKADQAIEGYSSAKAYANVEQMLDNSKPDAVYICVPPFAHGEIESLLVDRHIPFMVEKPLGTNLEIPKKIAQGVKKSGLMTSVGYHFRYTDAAIKAAELLESRKIGMALGYWMGDMPQVYWWRQQEGSGGQFIEQTTHMVDLLRCLLGEVDEVYAAFAHRAMKDMHDNVSVHDVGTATLKLKSGAVAAISNTCILPESEKVGLVIYTEQGSLDIRADRLIVNEQGRRTEYRNAANPYQRENEAFIHAVRTGETSGILSSYEDAVRTMEITYAALQSAETGLPVKIGNH
ncbi:gfo/Idh/MocA family oxidoreductase [Paenibacillus glucanolyticus]|jgi:myo-inositol 2-dehydrogenase/D-chiro-inositol 1-dehydrogenase|uniref:Gfo/Idh/MocA family protein n=1 Tax=Paenibacillus TaxID=44249 RepID=UPI0003E1FE47|nr:MULTISPECIES: Gfo/Idh/MocA family oxidoreductase [Paenibacillus]ANA81846.1 oxidoreductase [Paenibacillus glucanolyticus]AVV59421.1 gfo/Idh/MocA family oxidoreductase [Paenibacillus glucanolyticus]ETT43266.1 oxidoreductase domain-containing protein [Paenibacillus sp. FSL R5-808]MDH6671659.1 myo-inositol 2-dehydrogenase/D-chiro-inositol 1-dehydrogenase [Paenibacillus sp. LBL]MPY16048.1 Gfo/Idh/MocA family oxidoreductase [Paenibacillus glucanolyticus]